MGLRSCHGRSGKRSFKNQFPWYWDKKISLNHTTIKIAKCPGDIKNKTFDSIIKKRFYIPVSFRAIYQNLKY